MLILGSMPGSRSLRAGQYYAHPHNLFWPFMGEIFDAGPNLPYTERLARLQANKVALWDVLKECEREGSLDTSIVPASELANDFTWLLLTYPTIKKLCFNGNKAAASFTRLVQPTLPPTLSQEVTLFPLPSTSPANRGISTEVKLARWQTALLG